MFFQSLTRMEHPYLYWFVRRFNCKCRGGLFFSDVFILLLFLFMALAGWTIQQARPIKRWCFIHFHNFVFNFISPAAVIWPQLICVFHVRKKVLTVWCIVQACQWDDEDQFPHLAKSDHTLMVAIHMDYIFNLKKWTTCSMYFSKFWLQTRVSK